MKSFFQMSFQNSFRGDTRLGFRPSALGQDDVYEETPWTPPEDFQASYTPDTGPIVTTNPAIVTQEGTKPTPTRPPGASDTDWAKILSAALTEGAKGYGTYTTSQIQKMKAEADILKAKNPSVASLLPSDSKTATIALVVGGIAVLGLVLVVAIK